MEAAEQDRKGLNSGFKVTSHPHQLIKCMFTKTFLKLIRYSPSVASHPKNHFSTTIPPADCRASFNQIWKMSQTGKHGSGAFPKTSSQRIRVRTRQNELAKNRAVVPNWKQKLKEKQNLVMSVRKKIKFFKNWFLLEKLMHTVTFPSHLLLSPHDHHHRSRDVRWRHTEQLWSHNIM